MADDYYATLGVGRTASDEEIQTAYRQLARQYHPDLNPDDAKAKKKFQEVQNAFEVLNDSKKREMYDRYGSAYESVGPGGPGPAPGPGGVPPWANSGGSGPGVDINIEDLFGGGGGGFSDLFKNFGQRGKRTTRRAAPTRGSNIDYELTVPFTTAVLGGEAQIAVQLPEGRTETIQVKIPVGIEDGKKIRLRGQGNPSPNGGPDGDLMIKITAAPHPHFRRQGKRLDVRVPITLAEAIAGAKIDLPTPHGTITLTVPPGTSSGAKLRLKGQGVKSAKGAAGDLFAELQIVLPKNIGKEDREQLETIAAKYAENPRTELKW
ncbi:MAG: J domain-containing protein [Planctomycetes bacterium]|nr:J domain-containing protein [Planctomycetota bacterium]